MAVSLLSIEVSDLCIGKPALRPLPLGATVGEALAALRRCPDPDLSVWATDPSAPEKKACVGKISLVDVVCYLCDSTNLNRSPAAALSDPVSALLASKPAGVVRRVEPHCSVLEALDVILEGAQNLVVPISGGRERRKAAAECCWLTQEDFVRFFLNFIGHFSPAASLPVATLGVIRRVVHAVRRLDPAVSALPAIRAALAEQTSIAVVSDDGGQLVGEISPSTIAAGCDEGVAAALAALSAGEFMAYVDCGSAPPEAAVEVVRARLEHKGMKGMLDLLNDGGQMSSSSSSSSDEESPPVLKKKRTRSRGSYSARMGRKTEEAIVCHPESSLLAVMLQTLAHRVSYVWVVDEDYGLVGIVTFPDILRVLRDQLQQ